jgi:GTP cyclohydrolase II
MVRKVKHTVENRQADSPLAQVRYAQAYGLVATARLHWQEAVRVVSASHSRGPSAMTEPERGQYRLSLALSGGASAEAVRVIMLDPAEVSTGSRIRSSGSSAMSMS